MTNPIKVLMAMVLAGSALVAAPAQAIPLTQNSTVTVGNLQYTINSCIGLNNACATGELVASGTSVTFQNIGGTGNLETAPGTGATADTKVDFTVTVLDGAFLNGVNLSITGAGNLTSVGDTFLTTGGPAFTVQSGGTPGNNQTAAASRTFYTKSQEITADIGATDTSGAASVKSVTQTFNVPEPASLGLLVVGMAGLAGLRRRRTK